MSNPMLPFLCRRCHEKLSAPAVVIAGVLCLGLTTVVLWQVLKKPDTPATPLAKGPTEGKGNVAAKEVETKSPTITVPPVKKDGGIDVAVLPKKDDKATKD